MALSPGLSDICQTFRNPQLILYMAWSDIRARYRRSFLGPFWITIGTAVGVFGLSFIWSELFKIDRATYIPTLTVGLVLWQFLSACITESSSLFARQANIIHNLNLPIALHPAQLVLRHVLNLAHNMPLLLIVIPAVGTPINAHTLMFIPALLLVIANLYWMSLFVGLLGARFRDFEYLVAMSMPVLMFLSPVTYRPEVLQSARKFIWINPITDFIEIIRYPLLGQATPCFIYAINIGILAAGGIITFCLFNAKRNRVAFWV